MKNIALTNLINQKSQRLLELHNLLLTKIYYNSNYCNNYNDTTWKEMLQWIICHLKSTYKYQKHLKIYFQDI